MVRVIDLLKHKCGLGCQNCGLGCQNLSTCWRARLTARGGSRASTLYSLQSRSPCVIKANNPEVVAVLGEAFCYMVCDLEVDSIEGNEWSVVWYKMRPNGDWGRIDFEENPRFILSEDKVAVRIDNVMYEDRGIYKCEVKHRDGKYNTSQGEFNVIVVPQDAEDGRVRIRVEKTPICCMVGDKVTMAANIENKPHKCKVHWYKMQGSEEVHLSRRKVKITRHKDHTKARIRSVTAADSGVYRVKVVSEGDYAISHVILNVTSPHSEREVEERMKRAFEVADKDNEGLLTPAQVKEIMAQLGITVPNGSIDDVIYLAIHSSTRKVHYNTFIDKILYHYRCELGETT